MQIAKATRYLWHPCLSARPILSCRLDKPGTKEPTTFGVPVYEGRPCKIATIVLPAGFAIPQKGHSVEKPLKVEHFFPASGNNGQEKNIGGSTILVKKICNKKLICFTSKTFKKTN